jgi:hypothetical protein
MAADSPAASVSLHPLAHGPQIAASHGANAAATFAEIPFYIVIIRT